MPKKKSKNPPFKMLPFKWRQQVMACLKGVNLSVWLYHYWRTDSMNENVEISIPEMVDALPYSKRHISYARAWLVENGWLTCVTPTQKDGQGHWTVPTYKVSIGTKAAHGVRMRESRTPSSASLPHAEKPHRKKKVFGEEGTGSPSAIATGEVEKNGCVGVSLASLATSDMDASHPQKPPEQTLITLIAIQETVEVVARMVEECFDYKFQASMGTVKRILLAHPDFCWDSGAISLLTEWLHEKRSWKNKAKKLWSDVIRNQDDLAFRWESESSTGLYYQLRAALGRSTDGDEIGLKIVQSPEVTTPVTNPSFEGEEV